ncbi:Fibronectin type III domain-containing protein [Actinokineospora alba]|uniref:Fibronectin type III domain-containing protein n=1 Tax=Actinokineospora alba TaxID=504798 RepID=A0A1H0S2Q0_9PSEU|nr:fibronectin type III domain-containing protein [Actinokineospora alba]TDP66792.1 fibronectin type III domain protein [Actinokineospora alba]SDI49580.1 Fibronectin type III domain-containing protein [Actinokineospora alba]SDP36022.1 Fibronectin type III domain-containing protein [Actinokineospora alba]
MRSKRFTALLGATAIAVAGVGLNAGVAHAEVKTVTAERTCALTPMPITLPISVTLASDVKTTEYLYPEPDQTRIEGHVEFRTVELIAMGATTVSGALDADIVRVNGDHTFRAKVRFEFRKIALTSDRVRVPLVSYTPQLSYGGAGTATVSVDGLDLLLFPLRADGNPPPAEALGGSCPSDHGPDRWFQVEVQNVVADGLGSPGTPKASEVTSTGVTLTWTKPSSPFGVAIAYEVLVDEVVAKRVTDVLTTTLDGLAPDTDYWVRIRAIANYGGSYLGAPAKVRTAAAPAVAVHDYSLTGSASVKAARTSVALTGAARTHLDVGTGKSTSVVTLNPTKANVRFLGVLPLVADVTLTPVGATPGTLVGGVLTTTAAVNIGIPRVTFLGRPISQSATCATTVPAEITLRSGPGFDPVKGGTLTGEFTIPPVSGCGQADSMITSMMSGPGNTVQLALTP